MADLEQITETTFCCPLSQVSLGKPGQFIKSNGSFPLVAAASQKFSSFRS
jgi:hypothetical protein